MSYNTRRTSGPGGRNAPTTQVNYHQQPSRTGGNAAQPARNPGYSTTQQPASYNSSSQPAYSTPAYSTNPPLQQSQSKPAPQPQQPPASQQQPPSSQQPPTTPAIKQPPVTPANTPDMKAEPVTPKVADTPKADTTENGDAPPPKQPFWKKRPFVKVSNKVKKARQNAKLRRVLNPKNALTFLNELKPGAGKFVVREESGWGYAATVDIDGETFTGHGMSASKAKVSASEQALKHLLLEQLTKSQKQPPPATATESKEDKDGDTVMDTEDEGEEPKAKKPRVQPEDDVPWGSLAAFALHKLFSEWQKDGPEISAPPQTAYPPEKYDDEVAAEDPYFARRPPGPPEFGYPRRGYPPFAGRGRGFGPYPPPRGPPPHGYGLPPPARRPPPTSAIPPFLNNAAAKPPSSGAVGVLQPMKSIPEDANQRHPVMLLNQLKPNVIYNESREGESPRIFFVITVEIDGKEYVGRGRNKKEAKKQAAKAALAPLGIIYHDDD